MYLQEGLRSMMRRCYLGTNFTTERLRQRSLLNRESGQVGLHLTQCKTYGVAGTLCRGNLGFSSASHFSLFRRYAAKCCMSKHCTSPRNVTATMRSSVTCSLDTQRPAATLPRWNRLGQRRSGPDTEYPPTSPAIAESRRSPDQVAHGCHARRIDLVRHRRR